MPESDYNARDCSVCNEDAQYFCRMCSTHYCADHLCLHLNVAWENNTWTRREAEEREDDGDSSRLETLEDAPEIADQYAIPGKRTGDIRHSPPGEGIHLPSSNAKTLTSYTDSQLQSQLNFYISQSRRIKRELERRMLPSGSISFSAQEQSSHRNNKHNRVQGKPRKLSKQLQRTKDILVNEMRTGRITIEQLELILAKSVDTASTETYVPF